MLESLLPLPEKQLFQFQEFRWVSEPEEGKARRITESGYGGGGGAGAKIEPVAFIMISEEEARIFRISERNDAGSILSSIPELVPEIMDKLKGMKGKHKKEEKSEETGD